VAGGQVHAVGYERLFGRKFTARYWKNGEPVDLTTRGRDSSAQSVFVSGDDVYIAGYEGLAARYWKNGEPVRVAFLSFAESIFVDGSDVYIAGFAGKRARYWKNEEPVKLPAFWQTGKKTAGRENPPSRAGFVLPE
jgi:hypothetical protein